MSVLGFAQEYPFSPSRKINDTDWNKVVDNLTGSQVKSGSLTLAAPNNLTVGGTTTIGNTNLSGSITSTTGSVGIASPAYITGTLNIGGATTAADIISSGLVQAGTLTSNVLNAGNFFVPGGAITTITTGSAIITGPLTGSNITAGNVTLNNLVTTGSANIGGAMNITGTNNAIIGGNLTVTGSISGSL